MKSPDKEPDMDFHDEIAAELMMRQVEDMIEDGELTAEELADAKLLVLEANCDCGSEPDDFGRCKRCYMKYSAEEVDETGDGLVDK